MNRAIDKSDSMQIPLSAPRRSLLDLCREIHFGRIEDFDLRGGEPVLDPLPRVIREIKFNRERQPKSTRGFDIPLRNQTIELFDWFTRLRDCRICYLEVKHGQPFKMNIRHEAKPESSSKQ